MRIIRSVIATALAVTGLSIWGGDLTRPSQAQPDIVDLNPIQTENQNTGSTGWQIDYSNAATKVADDINGQIRGYASATTQRWPRRGGHAEEAMPPRPRRGGHAAAAHRCGYAAAARDEMPVDASQ